MDHMFKIIYSGSRSLLGNDALHLPNHVHNLIYYFLPRYKEVTFACLNHMAHKHFPLKGHECKMELKISYWIQCAMWMLTWPVVLKIDTLVACHLKRIQKAGRNHYATPPGVISGIFWDVALLTNEHILLYDQKKLFKKKLWFFLLKSIKWFSKLGFKTSNIMEIIR